MVKDFMSGCPEREGEIVICRGSYRGGTCPPVPEKGPGDMDLIDGLCLFDGNCTGFTHLDATLTTQTFVSIYRNGFIILHLKHFHRTDIYTFLTTFAFVFVNSRDKSHLKSLLSQ